MKNNALLPLLGLAGFLATVPAQANFNLSLRTTTGDASDSGAIRLYNGPDTSDPSESTDRLWFVIDLDGDGIWKNGAPGNVTYDGTVPGLIASLLDPDDYLYQTALNNAIQGRTLQSIVNIPSTAQTGGTGPGDAGGVVKRGFVILFNSSDLTQGGTFGFDEVAYGQTGNTQNAIPTSGNLNARVGQDTFASTYTFSTGSQPPPPPTLAGVTTQVNAGQVEFAFSFLSSSGASYQVQSATDLTAPIAWTNEGAPLPGNGATLNFSVTRALAEFPQLFFRIIASGN